MSKEAIKELAEQLGKGVDWVSDTLIPYMYDFCEYKIIIDTICTVAFGLIMMLGIVLIFLSIKAIRKCEGAIYEEDMEWGVLFIGIACAVLGGIVGLGCLDATLSWYIAPEVTFVEYITG